MITSDCGQIGNFCWINANQDYVLEVTDDVTGELIQTLPAWWGGCWWLNKEPNAYLNMISTVMAMLQGGDEQED